MKNPNIRYEIRTNGTLRNTFGPLLPGSDPKEFEKSVVRQFEKYRHNATPELIRVERTPMRVRYLAVCIHCAEITDFAGGDTPLCTVCKKPDGMVAVSRLIPVANADDAKGKADTAAEAMEEAYTPDTTTAAGNQPPALNAEPAPPNTTENFAAGNPILSPEAAELIYMLLTMDGHNIHLSNARIKVRTVYGKKARQEAIQFTKAHGRAYLTPKEEPRQSYEIRDQQNRTVQTVTIPQDAPVVTQDFNPDNEEKPATIANEISLPSTNKMEKSKHSGDRHVDYAVVSAGIKQGRKWQWKHHYGEEWITPINRREPAWDNRFRYRLVQEGIPQLTPIPKAKDEDSDPRPEHPDKEAMMPYLERGARWEYKNSHGTRWRKSTLAKPSWYRGNRYRIAEGEIERLDAIVAAEAEAYNAKKAAQVEASQSDKDTLRQAYGALHALFSVAGKDPEANDNVVAVYERAHKAALQIEKALKPAKD